MAFAEEVDRRHPRPWIMTRIMRIGDEWGWGIFLSEGDHWRRVLCQPANLPKDEAMGALARWEAEVTRTFWKAPEATA